MNPTRASFIPRYILITKAAQTLDTELSFFSHCSDSDQEDNTNNEDLEREIVLLRSSMDYFYANRVYPFVSRSATEDFCSDYLVMPPEEYIEENQVYWNRYKKRVWKICKKFEALENPRERYAFELGNRIWGGMSLEMMMQRGDQEDDEAMFSAEEEKEDDDDDEEGVLDKYPFLKSAFKFVSKDDDVVADEKKKKEMQIEELKRFLAKVNKIRLQAMALLDDLQS